METLDSFILVTHIIFGAAFVFTMAAIQIVTGPALSKISPGQEKQKAARIVQTRAAPAMDFAIIVMDMTAAYLLYSRWDEIGAALWLHIKTTFGFTALLIANLLHFYWRSKKKRLKAEGADEAFSKLSRRTLLLEKVVLTCAAITFLMGVTYNHFL